MLSSKGSAEAGRWRTDRVPYMREIMDCLSIESPIQEVVLMKGAQIAATEVGNNFIGYIIHHAPAPTMMVMPTGDAAQENSKIRIQPMIDATPVLRERIRPARSRDAGNTLLLKEFDGGLLFMTGANSSVGLRSKPIRNLFLDEIDDYPGDVDNQGDPLEQAITRTSTFERNRKIFIPSTPTVRSTSKIEPRFLRGDQRYYYVPCPHCGHYQRLQFGALKWPKGEPTKVHYECENCPTPIYNHHKTAMLEAGEWRAHAPQNAGRTASFHISSLYSPVGWKSWATIAEQWESAQGFPDRLKVFVNTVLGETWEERGEAPDWQKLYARRRPQPKQVVPAPVVFLTGYADVQKDRLEAQIIGWGRNKQKWVVDYIVLPGSPFLPEVWEQLTDLVNSTWLHASGVDIPLMRFGVDSGFATNEVYHWAAAQAPGKVLVMKGQEQGHTPLGTPAPVYSDTKGRKLKYGLKRWPVSTSLLKSELYGCLKLDPPTDEELAAGAQYPPGFFHFPEWLDAEYFQQLTAEQLLSTTNKRTGHTKQEWINTRAGQRNEALDTAIGARAAAAHFGLDRFSERWWQRSEEELWGPGGYTPDRDQTAALTRATACASAAAGEAPDAPRPARPQIQEAKKPDPPAAPRRQNNWLGTRRDGWIRR